jgi:hypothetical protein
MASKWTIVLWLLLAAIFLIGWPLYFYGGKRNEQKTRLNHDA